MLISNGYRMRFTIPGRLPGLNEVINKARYNRFAGAKQKKDSTELCRFYVVAAKLIPIRGPVVVHFTWYEPNARRDCDNVATGAKFILDALVDSGVLAGDGRKHVVGLSHLFPVPDKKNPRIEVFLAQA